jgi:hypothetical protein
VPLPLLVTSPFMPLPPLTVTLPVPLEIMPHPVAKKTRASRR